MNNNTVLHSDDEIMEKKNLDLCKNYLFRLKKSRWRWRGWFWIQNWLKIIPSIKIAKVITYKKKTRVDLLKRES